MTSLKQEINLDYILELIFETNKNILRLVVKKSPTGESTHYFFHSQDDKVEVSC